MDARGVPEATQLLCGVTNKCTTMRGPASVNMGVGDMMECLSVFIAAPEDPYLLGLDYLTWVGACMDLRGGRMRVQNQEVPLFLGADVQDV